MLSACCVCESPPSTFEYLNQSLWNLMDGTWAHLNSVLRKSLPSVCFYICILHSLLGNGSVRIPLSLLGNGSVKRYRGNEYTSNNRIIVGRVVFYAARMVSRKAGDYFFRELVLSTKPC
jgi:hypothetical protein